MAALTVTPANVSASQEMGAVISNFAVGSGGVVVGNLVAIDSNGAVVKADANSTAALARAVGVCVNTASLYGETSAAEGSYVSVCTHGPVYGFSGLSEGTYGFLSDTAGAISDTAITPGNAFAVGYCMRADTFFVHIGIDEPVSV